MAEAAVQVAVAAQAGLAVPLATIAAFWKEFSLDARRARLDEVGLHIADLQEGSTSSRRKLADTTREFKRSLATAADSGASAADASKSFGPLLKSYQEEIDSLTKRAKYAEVAFLELYQQLYEAPDPSSALASAAGAEARMAELEVKVRKLSVELGEYKAESKAIKNQDLTLRKQEETIRELTAALEAKESELASSQQQAAAQAEDALVARMQEREEELGHMLEGAQASLAAMQRLYTAAQNQLFELQSASEEAAVGKQFEWEAAAAELERAQEQLASLEAEKSALQERLSSHADTSTTAAGSGAPPGSSSVVEDTLRQDVASLRDVNARLRQDIAAARRGLADAEAAWGERVDGLQEALSAAERQQQELQQELQHRPTQAQVEELQQQVRALQAVGYGAVDETLLGTSSSSSGEQGRGQPSSSGGAGLGPPGSSSSSSMTLEGMLLAKNRKLEHDVTLARLQVAEASQNLEASQLRVSDLEAQVSDQQQLIEQLEDDLRAAASAGVGAQGLLAAGALGSHPSDSGGVAAGVLGDTNAAAGDHAEMSVVRVLAGQRDRLRQRVQELEEGLAAAKQEVTQVKAQLEAAKADNIALIERLRYVGGYRQQSAARAGAEEGEGKGGGGEDVEAGKGADVVGRYTRLYEEGINPFKEFQGQQRQQKKNQMGVADKAMYSMGNLVFQSPAARLAALCYLVLLHLLVFSALTRMSHHTSTHLSDHQDAILEHRHDLTRMMHHELNHGPGSAAAVSSSPAATISSSPAAAVADVDSGGWGEVAGGTGMKLVEAGGRRLLHALSVQLRRRLQH